MREIWKLIPGFDGMYEASNLGRLRSKWRGGRILRQCVKDTGYLFVNLSGGNVRRTHSLVMQAFHGLRPRGLEVRHLDGDKTNNALTNLEYATRSRNLLDKKWHRDDPKRLRAADVLDIKRRLDGPRGTGRILAREFGVTDAAISAIKHGINHKHM
jgi:hypothetical protein